MNPVAYKYNTVDKYGRTVNIVSNCVISPVGEFPVLLYAIPEGYKLVPIEPTEEMNRAGAWLSTLPDSYKTMIEAAPDIEDIKE